MKPRLPSLASRTRRTALAVVGAWCACASSNLLRAAAADLAPPEQLPAWVVADTPLRPSTAVHLEGWDSADAWSDRPVATLADSLRRAPGLLLLESFGGFEPPRLSLRGSGLQSAPSSRGVALLLDELPLGLADGSFNSALFDPSLSGAVTVFRGPEGWRAAPGALGGALDLASAATRADDEELRFEAGSFGARRARAQTALSAAGAELRGTFGHARQDGFRPHGAQERTSFLATLRRPTGSAGRTSFTLYRVAASYHVPGPLTLSAAETMPRSISADVRRDLPSRRATLSHFAVTHRHRTNESEWEAGGAFGRTTDAFRQLQSSGVTHSRSDDASFRLGFLRRFATGARPHAFRATTAAARGWRDQSRFTNRAGTTGTLVGRDALYPATVSVQLEQTVEVARDLTLTGGLAELHSRRDIVDRHATATPSTTSRQRSRALLPQASARWQPARAVFVFASASRATEAPTFDDLLVTTGSGPTLSRRRQPLADQDATTFELGTHGRRGAFTWNLTAYRGRWRNEILRLADPSGAALGPVNASQTTHQGLEATLAARISAGPVRLSLVTNATWARFAFASDAQYGRNRIAGFPPHLGTAELIAETPAGVFAAAGCDWTGGRTAVDHANRFFFGGSARTRLRVGRRTQAWTCFAEIQNVFDRATIASTAGVLDVARHPATTAIFLPAPGRGCIVGLEWRR